MFLNALNNELQESWAIQQTRSLRRAHASCGPHKHDTIGVIPDGRNRKHYKKRSLHRCELMQTMLTIATGNQLETCLYGAFTTVSLLWLHATSDCRSSARVTALTPVTPLLIVSIASKWSGRSADQARRIYQRQTPVAGLSDSPSYICRFMFRFPKRTSILTTDTPVLLLAVAVRTPETAHHATMTYISRPTIMIVFSSDSDRAARTDSRQRHRRCINEKNNIRSAVLVQLPYLTLATLLWINRINV